jgi:acetyl esterase
MSAQLDPDAQALLDVMRATGAKQPYELPVELARERMRTALVSRGEPLSLAEVRDVQLPSPHGPLPMRLYRPSEGELGMALFLHGGGWTLNDLDTHDRLCRRIAQRSGLLLAALHYRRAPEHRHPAPLEDALLAYRWLLDNSACIGGEPGRLALVGESSGGTTATCLSLLLRDLEAPPPTLQALAYPLTDVAGRWPSYRERGSGYTLDCQLVEWFMSHYLPERAGLNDPYLLPMAASELCGLPPTFVMTAEFDPLRDEGIAYAQRLLEAGVQVEHVHVADQMHGFLLLGQALPKAEALIDRLADALRAPRASHR